MTSLADLCSRIEAPDANAAAEAQRRLDGKTKPRGSLGRLEELARAARGDPRHTRARATEQGDRRHGRRPRRRRGGRERLSRKRSPRRWCANFPRGGAAINVLARQAGARVVVVDMGVEHGALDAAGLVGAPHRPRHAQLRARARR